MFQNESSFIKVDGFTEQRKSSVKASLKYSGGHIREVAATEVGKEWLCRGLPLAWDR